MYAIVRAGGKQVKVAPGDVVRIERTAAKKAGKGDKLELSSVVLLSDDGGVKAGEKAVGGAKVVATVLNEIKSRKVLVFKKKRTKQYRRTKGHRQNLIEIRIDSIEA